MTNITISQSTSLYIGYMREKISHHVFWGDDIMKQLVILLILFSTQLFANQSIEGKQWKMINPKPTANDLNGMCKTDTHVIVVGDGGTILKTKEGKQWEHITSPTVANLEQIANSGTILVAIGEEGTILHSDDDGESWTSQEKHTDQDLYFVHWTGKQFLAGGDSGTVLSSTNGTDWIIEESGTDNRLYDAESNGNRTVIVGSYGTIISSINTKEWITCTSETTNTLSAISWNGTTWLIVGSYTMTLNSIDGINWEKYKVGSYNGFWGCTWDGTRFIAVGSNYRIGYSNDGLIWSTKQAKNNFIWNSLRDVIRTGNTYIAIGENGSIIFADSELNWEHYPYEDMRNLTSIAISDNFFYATGEEGLIYSADEGQKWNSVDLGADIIAGAAKCKGKWYTASTDGKVFTLSENNNWEITKDFRDEIYDIVAIDSFLIIARDYGSLYYTTNGTDWKSASTRISESIRCIKKIDKTFYVVGEYGSLSKCTSDMTELSNWEVQDAVTSSNHLNAIAGNNTTVVAVGNQGVAYYCSDSTNWIKCTIPSLHEDLEGVTWTGEEFLAVGDNGLLLLSKDGIDWSRIQLGYTFNLKDIESSKDEIIIVGDQGLVLQISSKVDNILSNSSQYKNALTLPRIRVVDKKISITTSNKEPFEVSLFTLQGKEVFRSQVQNSQSGAVEIPMSTSLGQNRYVIKIRTSNVQYSSKVMLQ